MKKLTLQFVRRGGTEVPPLLKTTVAPLLLALCLVQPAAAQEAQDYVIGPEDVLDIVVWNNATISRTVPVRPDGKISLPLLNDLPASGFTPAQLRETLVKALTEYIPTPSVSVIVREVHSFKVTVIGQVRAPGRFELKSSATVLDMLAMAGGLTEYASRGDIVVLRQDGATTRKVPFAYDRLTEKTDAKNRGQGNFNVQSGDVVLVP